MQGNRKRGEGAFLLRRSEPEKYSESTISSHPKRGPHSDCEPSQSNAARCRVHRLRRLLAIIAAHVALLELLLYLVDGLGNAFTRYGLDSDARFYGAYVLLELVIYLQAPEYLCREPDVELFDNFLMLILLVQNQFMSGAVRGYIDPDRYAEAAEYNQAGN